MVDAPQDLLTQRGLRAGGLHADAFFIPETGSAVEA
jgi:hypothetical protein